jgi:magnesium chelatase subunit I
MERQMDGPVDPFAASPASQDPDAGLAPRFAPTKAAAPAAGAVRPRKVTTMTAPLRPPPFPFAAIVGQEEMKRALLLAAIDPTIGGVLIFGDRGTGKSTAIRALAALLPPMRAVVGDAYNRAPDPAIRGQKTHLVPVPVVDLPLGATEDRVVGSLDLEKALASGEKAFQPGLLARANRGFLYIDEANLLEDHLVDVLLDVAASGENVVEREGLSIRHPARFVLVGSGNPEEGELRPQLLDRFGLSVDVTTPTDLPTRVEVVKRRDLFDRDPHGFAAQWRAKDEAIGRKLTAGRRRLAHVATSDAALTRVAELCLHLGTDGLRGELTLMRAARALAALDGCDAVVDSHIRTAAPMALRHRLRRNPIDETGSTVRIERALAEVFGP